CATYDGYLYYYTMDYW
nr:immunoglobulin heavy chain junction region [Mus musculus]MBK4186278.1 immunoglobulin heavy chain junction region [Mus musculus]MBK4186279.1 immunoglobulin heavy chain junction region [Mus musculus]